VVPFSAVEEPTCRLARALRDALKEKAFDTTHAEALELIAKAFGYENWNILSAKIEAAEPAASDERSPSVAAAARRAGGRRLQVHAARGHVVVGAIPFVRRAICCLALCAVPLITSTPTSAADIFATEVNTKGGTCDVVLAGTIERSDDEQFRRQLTVALKNGCSTPRILVYSSGGNLQAAMKIGRQIRSLRLPTVGPELLASRSEDEPDTQPRDGPRVCRHLPGSAERAERQAEAAFSYSRALRDALERNRPMPKAPKLRGDFDPRSGVGDPRCSCGSVGFLIWAAGSERMGDVIQIQRPSFEPKDYTQLDATAARQTFQSLMIAARHYLTELGVQAALIDRMYSTEATRSFYLSADELQQLRMIPHWAELKIAHCGPEPIMESPRPTDADQQRPPDAQLMPRQQLYAQVTPRLRQHLIELAEREVCWLGAQKTLRQPAIGAYLAAQ
jgi:hypothetical protein